MIRISSGAEKGRFEGIKHLALAIRRHLPPDHLDSHVGILYKTTQHDLVFLNFVGDRVLQLDAPHPSYFIVDSDIDPRLLLQFSIWLDIVGEVNKDVLIPYGISPVGGSFNGEGQYVPSAEHEGFTCATFVLAVFEGYGIALIAKETWPPPKLGDTRFFKRILDRLQGKLPEKHLHEQTELINSARRFKPVHVAAAFGIFVSDPLSYREVDKVGREVDEFIKPK